MGVTFCLSWGRVTVGLENDDEAQVAPRTASLAPGHWSLELQTSLRSELCWMGEGLVPRLSVILEFLCTQRA